MNLILIFLLLFFSCNDNSNESIETTAEKNKIQQINSIDSSKLHTDLACGEFIFYPITKEFKGEKGLINSYQYDLGFYEKKKKLLFLISNLDRTIKVIDICNGREVLSVPLDYVSIDGIYEMDNRYFIGIVCKGCEEVEVWEFEFELERLEVVDIPRQDLIKVDCL